VWTVGDLLKRAATPSADRAPADLAEHAMAGTLKFYGRADLDGQPRAADILERYTESAAMTARAAHRLATELCPDVAVSDHGIYVPQGVVCDELRARGVRIVTWMQGYRRGTFLFSHDETYHRTMVKEDPVQWEAMPWDAQRRRDIERYLLARRTGLGDWTTFIRGRVISDPADIRRLLHLDPNRPLYALFTNVAWDAQLHFVDNAFPSQLHWLKATLQWFAQHLDRQLVIRVHPAELRGRVSRQRVADDVARIMPVLPPNIRVVAPDSAISTCELGEMADAALIYGTKVGIELAAFGVPVVVAGEAWVRGKGFTIDVRSPQEYLRALDRLPVGVRLDDVARERALRYAYHVFFRRMIQLRIRDQRGHFTISSLSQLMPGVDPGLDVICDGILHATPFLGEYEDDQAPEGRRRHPLAALT
jgi:hypothetical protein